MQADAPTMEITKGPPAVTQTTSNHLSFGPARISKNVARRAKKNNDTQQYCNHLYILYISSKNLQLDIPLGSAFRLFGGPALNRPGKELMPQPLPTTTICITISAPWSRRQASSNLCAMDEGKIWKVNSSTHLASNCNFLQAANILDQQFAAEVCDSEQAKTTTKQRVEKHHLGHCISKSPQADYG